MKKIILDENLPQPLRHEFGEHQVVTVGFMGWSGTQNGEQIKEAIQGSSAGSYTQIE